MFESLLNPDHPLRPATAPEIELWDATAKVPDPEIPVISIADLGILREVRFENDTAVVTITPTYSGCPAMGQIVDDITVELAKAGYKDARVETVLHPAWTTDWITATGKRQLKEFGIAPPESAAKRSTGPVLLNLAPPPRITCPHCGSDDTNQVSRFGSTSCKALFTCNTCFEPFDYFKVH
ncbi:1,2-phenylacetyl-CoA epoxidase subunit PaaD [Corynebacterium lehmanniae]|nr:1,2-phenylacetyl-CoA epoxidase subunit PaaD [Corynebacterium lehmanniae]